MENNMGVPDCIRGKKVDVNFVLNSGWFLNFVFILTPIYRD